MEVSVVNMHTTPHVSTRGLDRTPPPLPKELEGYQTPNLRLFVNDSWCF
jgi:hypothetical protein